MYNYAKSKNEINHFASYMKFLSKQNVTGVRLGKIVQISVDSVWIKINVTTKMAAAYTDVPVVITDFSVGTVSILNMKFYGKLDFVPNEDTG